jgi:WD40 repeat protein
LRGFEWRYLWNLCRGQELATLTGHSWIVTCSAFSPDGRLLATGSQDGAANVWDVDRRERITTLGTPPDGVWSVGFSPEGDLLMTAADRAVSLYSTATWQLITNFPGQIAVLSKTGSLLAVSESNPFRWERVGPVSLWDYHTMRKLREFGQPGRALALSPDGRQLAAGGKDTGVYLWNTASGELLRTLPTDQSVWSMAFSPDGKRLTTAGWSSEALVWDLEAREPPARIKGHALNVWSANFSPDGATIVTTSSDQTIRSWDAQSLLAKDVFRGHDNEVWCAAFRPDGKMMATGGKDRTVRMWPAQLPPQKRDLPAQNGIRPYFSPDGTRIGLAGPAANGWHPQVWDVEQRKAIADVPDGLLLGFSPDGRVVRLNEESMSLDSWAPTNSTVSSVKLDGIEPGKVKLVRAGFSPDRKFLFALDTHGVAGVWEAATGKSVGSAKGPSPPFRATALGLGGKWLAISLERDNPVRLYETRTGRETLLSGHHDFVSGLAFSPDGASLATGSMDATIRLWDLNTGKHFATFAGHLEEVTDLAFAPDGRTLASLGQRDSFKLWHLATQRELLSWNIPNAGLFLMFSPDGKRLAVTTGNNSLRLFEAPAEISQ